MAVRTSKHYVCDLCIQEAKESFILHEGTEFIVHFDCWKKLSSYETLCIFYGREIRPENLLFVPTKEQEARFRSRIRVVRYSDWGGTQRRFYFSDVFVSLYTEGKEK